MPAFAPMPRTPWRAMTDSMRTRAVTSLTASGRPLAYVARRLHATEEDVAAFVEKHGLLREKVKQSDTSATPEGSSDSPIVSPASGVHVSDRRANQCAYPLWSARAPYADKFVCAEPVAAPGQVYCPACRMVMFAAPPPKTKKKAAPKPAAALEEA